MRRFPHETHNTLINVTLDGKIVEYITFCLNCQSIAITLEINFVKCYQLLLNKFPSLESNLNNEIIISFQINNVCPWFVFQMENSSIFCITHNATHHTTHTH